ncbi:MAG TPA: TraR/DksA C4-type zinc finger protein [Methylomirabilota bacterium]|jgi:DnaK suppressor protein|nr:TraR/DksA C4-type zinc finger protein [Methylomirabilota bacterium]
MDEIRKALQEQLAHTVDRLKGLGGAVAFEEDPGAREDEGQGEAAGDAGRISEEREMTFAVRGLLVERANRLAEALERLRAGEYGVCEVCGEPISPARLRAIPEVTTCVRCQDAEERRTRVAPEQLAQR